MRQSVGHVKIYSEIGEGTTVKIYIPRHTGAADDFDGIYRNTSTIGTIGVETILVVEDDDALRIYAVEILSALGYSVLAAPHAAAALKIIDRGHKIDLLFTDIVMSGSMNGRRKAANQRPVLGFKRTSRDGS